MWDEDVTTQDLLTAWRDATRAAELAARLAEIAVEAADSADERALASADITEQAQAAAVAAQRAANSATAAAEKATELAARLRGEGLTQARATVELASATEVRARDEYHVAEAEARKRHGGDGSS